MLSCNKSSHIDARGGQPRHKGLGYSVVGNSFHLRQWCSNRHAEVNAESLSEYEHDQKLNDKPTVECDIRIGRQTAP